MANVGESVTTTALLWNRQEQQMTPPYAYPFDPRAMKGSGLFNFDFQYVYSYQCP